MSISIIIVLWIIISIAQAINDRKKTPPPPQVPPPQNSTDLNFEIPTLANDPNQKEDIEGIGEVKEVEVLEEVEEISDIEEIYRRRKLEEQNKTAAQVQSKIEPVEEKNVALDLTPAAVLNSIIMNDILDKPKALRRRNF